MHAPQRALITAMATKSKSTSAKFKTSAKKANAKKAAPRKAGAKKVATRKVAARKVATKQVPTERMPKKKAAGAPKKKAPNKRTAKTPVKSRAAAKTAVATQSPALDSRLRIRMYRHGLGDCLLLMFRKPDGGSTNVLIDCGLISVAEDGTTKVKEMVQNIGAATDNKLDVVAMTHEHWDHASGFKQARELFDGMDVAQAWYAWTEDDTHPLSKKLRDDRALKVSALAAAVQAMSKNPGLADRVNGVHAVLGFFGLGSAEELASATAPAAEAAAGTAPPAPIKKTREAFEYFKGRQEVPKRFLRPGQTFELPGVKGVRVYVLGPPENEAFIRKSAPTKKGREVYEFSRNAGVALGLNAAFERLAGKGADGAFDDCPFDTGYRQERPSRASQQLIANLWDAPRDAWRRIDVDWTQAAETLAIDLDNHTNNSCLVLAFEFTDTKEVCLFPADAQVGSWLSWQDLKWSFPEGAVTGPDLLARTVFYKVGHHGSHNATLREQGLEQMTSDNLTAFIPVFEDQARKNRWMAMPFPSLVERLKEKTRGRLLKSDEPAPAKAKGPQLIETKLYFELAL